MPNRLFVILNAVKNLASIAFQARSFAKLRMTEIVVPTLNVLC